MSEFFELIKVTDKYSGSGDFNGKESVLSLEEQRDYLKEYYRQSVTRYGFKECEKVVSDGEIKAALDKIDLTNENSFRNRLCLTELSAYTVKRNAYKNLYLYTDKCVACGGVITVRAGESAPNGAFKIECGKSVKSAEFSFKISEDFFTPLRGGTDTLVGGKVIELRRGTEECVKLQIYSDGQFCLRLPVTDAYHYQNVLLCKIEFGKTVKFKAEIIDKKCIISVDGKERYAVDVCAAPDTLFYGNGAIPVGDAEFCDINIITQDGKLNVFEKSCENYAERFIGKVNLPYAVGTEKFKDETLVLRKNFVYSKGDKRAFLYADTLDPCGEIFINGKLVKAAADYSAVYADVTDFIENGDNELEIKVNPRAPEVLYPWHRHKDPYNGWFCGEVFIESLSGCFVKSVQSITKEALNGSVRQTFKLEIACDATCEKTLLTEVEGVKSICTPVTLARGENCVTVNAELNLNPWSPDSPALYNVKFSLIGANEKPCDEYYLKTGFRTIEQKNGAILLNGKDFIMKGALLMQFLPPYENVPVNHVCPTNEEIVFQALAAKKMGCNSVRMHQLGYGSGDARFTRVFDALGLTVIWITRAIDSVNEIIFSGEWKQKSRYLSQIKKVINSPSVIMYEGVNETYLTRSDIDAIYREFVRGVKSVDTTRLLCPVSHLYYANDSYDHGCEYYQDDGLKDEFFRPVRSAEEWNDELVVRSAHTYERLLGYGADWQALRLQNWSAQGALLDSDKHAYIVSEYAVIGRADPAGKEKGAPDVKSYELGDEKILGYDFDGDFKLSQAYQALAAKYDGFKMLSLGADGLLWCCLTGGANDGSYLKPPIDFSGNKKLAFYALKETFADTVFCKGDTDLIYGKSVSFTPTLVTSGDGNTHDVKVIIENSQGERVYEKTYPGVKFDRRIIKLDKVDYTALSEGYYVIVFEVEEK